MMDEHQKKLNQRHEGRPRKVRFKISSAYSGRVLKQVYEDGQELEPPAKEHSRRFLRHSFEPGDHFCGAGEAPENRFYSPAKLTAQQISIFKEDKKYSLTSNSLLLSDCPSSDSHCRMYQLNNSYNNGGISALLITQYQPRRTDTQTLSGVRYTDIISRLLKLESSPILDFGKIIIYTNNLKIIRAPMNQKELMRRIIQTEGINDWAFIYRERKERFGGGHKKDVENKVACNQYAQKEGFNRKAKIHPIHRQTPIRVLKKSLLAFGGICVEKDLHKERDAEHGCSQCKGSGSAPCSLCHGSKFSMLANRFKESYRALRCPACNESGLQPCQICAA